MESFIKKSNLPKNKVSLVIVDGRIPRVIEEKLLSKDIRLIKTEAIKELYEAIAYHPDVMMCYLGEGDIVVAPNIPERVFYSLEKEGLNIKLGKKVLKAEYPYDIPYNVAIIDKYFICNFKNTDEVLLEELGKKSFKAIDVRQGYSKCSVCIVDQNKVITADAGIAKTLENTSIEVLLISQGSIELFNMNYGFIGGASGKLSDSELAFYGSIELHPDFERIKEFLCKNNKKIVNLSENKLIDLGTLLPLKEYSI